jgi:NAD(P)-dependent dehydrogenase (short-subunit alcohol dehydrogenase family)
MNGCHLDRRLHFLSRTEYTNGKETLNPARQAAATTRGIMANKIDLGGRFAVVTGGAQGIGRAIVERFLDSGASVAIWDRDVTLAQKTAKELGNRGKTIAVAADVTDYPHVERARDETIKAFGRIDILANNAGVAGLNTTTWEYPVEEWRRVMAINLDSQFHCCKAVVPGMMAQNYGRIVNIASVAGKEGNPNASAYSASKAAVIGFTKSLGKELATKGILVNCITPATFESAILSQLPKSQIDYMKSKIPMGRLGEAVESAALVCWLASEECSFSTGATFDISGGRTTY